MFAAIMCIVENPGCSLTETQQCSKAVSVNFWRICFTTSELRRGLLVPVANPEAVAALMAVAFAASDPNDPPLALALVPRPDRASHSRTHPENQPPPPTAALVAALEY